MVILMFYITYLFIKVHISSLVLFPLKAFCSCQKHLLHFVCHHVQRKEYELWFLKKKLLQPIKTIKAIKAYYILVKNLKNPITSL